MPRITVITVTYNSEETLAETMDSVLAQTYSDIEYIIVDGSSKDRTVDIIRQYEPHFQGRMRWISEPDKGIYDAMNKGIAMATGEVVGILNSDDLFLDAEVLADVASSFEEEQVDCVHGNLYFVEHDNTDRIVRIWQGSPYKTDSFARGWQPAHPTFYVRRKHYLHFGGYDISFHISADFELMLRFLEKHKLHSLFIDRFLVKMRMGGVSTKSMKSIYIGNREDIKAFHKNDIPVSLFYPLFRLVPKALDKIKLKLHLGGK